MAERGLTRHQADSSTLDIVPPPGVTRLEPRDFIEATVEQIVIPKLAKNYYGPSTALRTALTKDENTWRMIHHEAVGNDDAVTMQVGTLERLHPDLRIRTEKDTATFDLTGGINYIPVTFTGLTSPRNSTLTVNGVPLNQAVHGSDFWQTDYDPVSRTGSRTYNIPPSEQEKSIISLDPIR